jgi:hypothetical protein
MPAATRAGESINCDASCNRYNMQLVLTVRVRLCLLEPACHSPEQWGEWYGLGSFLVEYGGAMLNLLQAERSHKKGGKLRLSTSRGRMQS